MLRFFTATVLVLIVSIIQPIGTVFARDATFRRDNYQLHYEDGGEACAPGSSSSPSSSSGASPGTATPSDGLSAEQAAFVDEYHEIAEKLSIQYGIPWEAVMAQGILESTAGTSEYARERNNFFGIGAFDSNPDNAFRYATPEEGWEGYYKNIVKTPTYRQHGIFKGDTVTDPYAYIEAAKASGYATDPDYVSKVSHFIRAVELRSTEKGWKNSADLAKENAQMLENAKKNSDPNATVSPDSSSGGASDSKECKSGSNASILSGDCKELVPKFEELVASGDIILTSPERQEQDMKNCTTDQIECGTGGTGGVNPDILRAFIAATENSDGPVAIWSFNTGHGCDGLNHPKGKAVDIPCGYGSTTPASGSTSLDTCKQIIDYVIAHKEELGITEILWQDGYRCDSGVNCNVSGHGDHIHLGVRGSEGDHDHDH